MTDDGNMMEVAGALFRLRMLIDDLGRLYLDPRDLQELEQSTIRIHNLLKKHRNPHRT